MLPTQSLTAKTSVDGFHTQSRGLQYFVQLLSSIKSFTSNLEPAPYLPDLCACCVVPVIVHVPGCVRLSTRQANPFLKRWLTCWPWGFVSFPHLMLLVLLGLLSGIHDFCNVRYMTWRQSWDLKKIQTWSRHHQRSESFFQPCLHTYFRTTTIHAMFPHILTQTYFSDLSSARIQTAIIKFQTNTLIVTPAEAQASSLPSQPRCTWRNWVLRWKTWNPKSRQNLAKLESGYFLCHFCSFWN